MEIYLLKQDWNNDYDTYDSVVVIAENEQEARKIHPSEYVTHVKDGKWMGTYSGGENIGNEYEHGSKNWVQFSEIDRLKVTHVGKADDNQKRGFYLHPITQGKQWKKDRRKQGA